MARDLSQEPLFPTTDIQGDILAALPKKVEHLLFFRIDHLNAFKAFLRTLPLTSMQDCLDFRSLIAARKQQGIATLVPTPGLNLAFTFAGLARLGIPNIDTAAVDPAFKGGMASRKDILADPGAAHWKILHGSSDLHGVFILTGATEAEIADIIALNLAPMPGNGWHLLHEEIGTVRPNPVKGHEHFGFADGVSQPGVRGRIGATEALTPSNSPDENQGDPGQDLLWPGEFVFGYPGQNPGAPNFAVKGDPVEPPLPFMANGAYLVFRRLAQEVPEFKLAVKRAAAETGGASDAVSPDLLGAQMVGRWKSGAPIIKAPTADDPSLADGTLHVNDFEFGDDRPGLLCPWAAHVRKAYPRNDVRHNLTPSDAEVDAAEAFSQSHRMLRRGIAFGPELSEHEAKSGQSSHAHERGLLFMCYVTSLVDQFEFVQQSWVDADDFSQPGAGLDPIISQPHGPAKPFLGAAPFSKDPNRKPELNLRTYVKMEGGEYFFAPSIPAIRDLAQQA